MLDQSDGVDFIRWRIQYLGNRNNGVRSWNRAESAWPVLAELTPSLIGSVNLLNMACIDDGTATWGASGLNVVTKACLFNFLDSNGANKVGRLNITIDFRQSYPYTDVRIMNGSGAMQQLTKSGNKWVLTFTPGNVSLMNGHIIQSLDGGTLYTIKKDTVSGTSFCGGTYTQAFRLYRWNNIALTTSSVSGTPTLVSKSAAGNPPGSTFLPTSFDRHLARFTFGASGDFAFSGSKWDPHVSGFPWVCSQDNFFNMGVLAEPY